MKEKEVIELHCETALNRLKRRFPYQWDLNIYRGCHHGCIYCYAIYSHDYLGSDNYYKDIYVKTNIIEKLEKQLSHPDWKREIINIGGVSDSYQPVEKEYKLMPEVLKLLIKYKTPAIISTKSNLIIRDYELIDELSRITYINIASTITTTNEGLRRIIESGSSSSEERFAMLKLFRNTNASVGLHVMPIIPYLTDDYDDLNSLFSMAKDSDVHYVLTGTLYLRGKTRKQFLNFIENKYPYLSKCYENLYKTGGANKLYKDSLYKIVNELRARYSLSSNYSSIINQKLKR